MSFSIEVWLKEYVAAVKNQFNDRVWFIGLQGSFARGEANEHSDIDVVLILDTLSADDLEMYDRVLNTLPEREKVCGFMSGKKELLAWERSDLFQFYYDTVAVYGCLDVLLNQIKEHDVYRAIHTGVCNIYHMCVHNLVHEKSPELLKGLYKSALFTLQAIAFIQTGEYARKKQDLANLLQQQDKGILNTAIKLKAKKDFSADEFRQYSRVLLEWASGWIDKVFNMYREN